jgi:hypothetical protein
VGGKGYGPVPRVVELRVIRVKGDLITRTRDPSGELYNSKLLLISN